MPMKAHQLLFGLNFYLLTLSQVLLSTVICSFLHTTTTLNSLCLTVLKVPAPTTKT